MRVHIKKILSLSSVCTLFFLLVPGVLQCRTVKQLVPVLTISEEYSDNYLKTDTGRQEEFITTYGLSFSLGFLNKTSKIYLNWAPEYDDHKEFNDRDGFRNNIGLDAAFNPTKFTNINANLLYAGNNDNYQGESWSHHALISGTTQLTKNSEVSYSESFKRSFDQQLRTGDFKEHDVNKSSISYQNQFGEKSRWGVDGFYEFDNYKDQDADEYKKIGPSAFITYWFNPLNAFELNGGYEKTDYDNSNNDLDTYSGYIKYIHSYSKHFDGYLKYKHTYTDRSAGDHRIYNPSVGFNWDVTKDAGITLGIGLLISEWDNSNSDTVDPFLDLNAYKIFNFSRRGSLSITGTSGYSDAGEDAASLGYTTYYKAGFKLDYQLQKRLGSYLIGSYRLNEFHETSVNRKDTRYTVGGGLKWQILKWLNFNLTCTHTNFDTDTGTRDDYKENKIYASFSLVPRTPVKMDFTPSQSSLNNELFNSP